MNTFIKIDINNWERKSVFDFFSTFENQLFSIDFDLKLPNDFNGKCTRLRTKPYFINLFAMAKVLNEHENFRYRLLDGEVVLFDKLDPIWVEIDKNNNLVIVTCEYDSDIKKFRANMKKKKIVEANYMKENPSHFTVSNNHWLDWTSVTHTRYLHNESNQKLVWGPIRNDSVRFSMETSHLFVDGYHVSQFKERVEALLLELV